MLALKKFVKNVTTDKTDFEIQMHTDQKISVRERRVIDGFERRGRVRERRR